MLHIVRGDRPSIGDKPDQAAKCASFRAMNRLLSAGTSPRGKIASEVRLGIQAPQSMHSAGSYIWEAGSKVIPPDARSSVITCRMPKLGSDMPNMGTTVKKRTTSVADALFTVTQQRVLSLLFGQPDRSFIQQDLIERAGGRLRGSPSRAGPTRRERARDIERRRETEALPLVCRGVTSSLFGSRSNSTWGSRAASRREVISRARHPRAAQRTCGSAARPATQ